MASSKVITTASQTHPDLPRQSSLCSSLSTLLADLPNRQNNQNQSPNGFGSVSMDDLLKNIYSSPPPPPTTSDAHPQFPGSSLSREGSFSFPKDVGDKSVDEVWKEIVAGGGDQRQEGPPEGMTLEDFLTKAEAIGEEDGRGVVNQVGVGAGVYAVDPVAVNGDGSQFSAFGNNRGFDHRISVATEGKGARGKRRAMGGPPLDKATEQKQRRRIKNRESAARSRERKQAYTVELESMVTKLEEENARLLREELMQNLVPVEEKQRPTRVLRRVHSMEW
ncbi:hypothetical protein DITRI_Ditri08aG0151600 [Diplodiscus trichospermus]